MHTPSECRRRELLRWDRRDRDKQPPAAVHRFAGHSPAFQKRLSSWSFNRKSATSLYVFPMMDGFLLWLIRRQADNFRKSRCEQHVIKNTAPGRAPRNRLSTRTTDRFAVCHSEL